MARMQQTELSDARRFARVAYDGNMIFRYASDVAGTARVSDVGRGGLRIRMGRYLRPGTRVMLETDAVRVDGQPVELKGQIVWCAPEKPGHRFAAGVRVIYDEPDTVAAVSALVKHALHATGVLDELTGRAGPAAMVAAWTVRAMGNGTRNAAAALAANA